MVEPPVASGRPNTPHDGTSGGSGGGNVDYGGEHRLGADRGPGGYIIGPVDGHSVDAGWYVDPWRRAALRWWDGTTWTGYIAQAKHQATVLGQGWVTATDNGTGLGGGDELNEGGNEAVEIRGGGIALGGFFAGVFAAAIVILGLSEVGASTTTQLVGGQAVMWSFWLGACMLAVNKWGTGSLRDLGLRGIRKSDVGLGVAGGLVARVAATFIAIIVILVWPGADTHTKIQTVSLGEWAVYGIIACVGAPFVEELLCRGLIQGVLVRRLGIVMGLIGQATLFGLAHWTPDGSAQAVVSKMLAVGVGGLIFGILRWQTKRLGAGMVAHCLFNLIATFALLSYVR